MALFALDRLIRDLGANPNAYKRNLKKIAEKHIALKIDDRSMEVRIPINQILLKAFGYKIPLQRTKIDSNLGVIGFEK